MDTNFRSSGQEKKVDWQSSETAVQLNHRWPVADIVSLKELAHKFSKKSHVWIASSGSSAKDLRSVKLIALSKQAFLVAAQAANSHLSSHSHDIWINPLPDFHVGGLSIEARAFLSGACVVNFEGSWSAQNFTQLINDHKGTLTSLVPTQVFDLVENKLESPSSLRAVIVGGGSLAADLYNKAMDLGWPILPSFGMTETCSQIATAELDSIETRNPRLKILPHIEANITTDEKLMVRGPSLLTGYAQWVGDEAKWVDMKQDGWFMTEDQVSLIDGYLIPRGRGSQYIKILGEGVSLFRLQEIFEQVLRAKDPEGWKLYALVAIPHKRKGHQVSVAHTDRVDSEKLKQIILAFNSAVLSIEKIEQTFVVQQIPRSDLGKIKYEQIVQDLKNRF